MLKRWSEISQEWLRKTSLPSETAKWALHAINKNQIAISNLEEDLIEGISIGDKQRATQDNLKELKRRIKNEITCRENELDNLSLNTPNSYKLQLSVPSNLNYLMKAWAAAEGRDLSSVAMQCMETGLRDLKSKGSIPSAALNRYEIACEKRIALAEANDAWERHERFGLKESVK